MQCEPRHPFTMMECPGLVVIVTCEGDFKIVSANRAFIAAFGSSVQQLRLDSLAGPTTDVVSLISAIERASLGISTSLQLDFYDHNMLCKTFLASFQPNYSHPESGALCQLSLEYSHAVTLEQAMKNTSPLSLLASFSSSEAQIQDVSSEFADFKIGRASCRERVCLYV